jgi:ABC-2 type transport system ATP-binding protein
MGSYAVEARNLRKIFRTREGGILFRGKQREIVAVNDVSFYINFGEIFGLLGPNGAGKTTTIKILSTLLLPDSGEAWVNGFNVVTEAKMVRESIGVSLYSDRGFYWKLTGRENLMYFARLYHLQRDYAEKRINELFNMLDLAGDADRLVEEYSTGMKSKLNIARALLHDPPILFLDEPTIGLDPNSARKVREVVLELKKQGKTILLTTHNMFEAEYLSDRVAIINKGRIIAIGTPRELKEKVSGKRVVELEVSGNYRKLEAGLKDIGGVEAVSLQENNGSGYTSLIRIIYSGDEVLDRIIAKLANSDVKIRSLRNLEPTLEDVFVYYTGERLAEKS